MSQVSLKPNICFICGGSYGSILGELKRDIYFREPVFYGDNRANPRGTKVCNRCFDLVAQSWTPIKPDEIVITLDEFPDLNTYFALQSLLRKTFNQPNLPEYVAKAQQATDLDDFTRYLKMQISDDWHHTYMADSRIDIKSVNWKMLATCLYRITGKQLYPDVVKFYLMISQVNRYGFSGKLTDHPILRVLITTDKDHYDNTGAQIVAVLNTVVLEETELMVSRNDLLIAEQQLTALVLDEYLGTYNLQVYTKIGCRSFSNVERVFRYPDESTRKYDPDW
jgi:hypothetical protein